MQCRKLFWLEPSRLALARTAWLILELRASSEHIVTRQ
jgi:hypothetical protein